MFQLFIYVLLYQAFANQKLLQVQIYIRHGIRTQYFAHWNPNKLGDNEKGQLTTGGIRQMYLLGQNIKKEYMSQLSIDQYPFNQIYVRSTDLDRSMMSAHVLNFAMFENTKNTSVPKNLLSLSLPPILNIQEDQYIGDSLPNGYWPISYHTIPIIYDSLLLGWDPAPCPVVTLLNEKNQKSEEMQKANSDWQPFFKILRDKNLDVTNLIQAGEIADDIFSSLLSGEQIPRDLTKAEFQALDYARNIYFQITDFNHYNQVRFQATPFIENMIQKMDVWNSTRLLIYIGHDNNIFQILNLLNLTNWECVHQKAMSQLPLFGKQHYQQKTNCQITTFPEFGSQAIFELWTSTDKDPDEIENQYVKFKYNGEYYPICPEKKLKCPYHRFKILFASLIFQDYEEKCRIQRIDDQSQRATIMIFTIMLFVFSFLFLIIGFNYKKQQEMELIEESLYREYEMRNTS